MFRVLFIFNNFIFINNADVENCGSFKSFGYIYIYIYNNKRRERERETIKERPRMCLDQDEPMFGILPFFFFFWHAFSLREQSALFMHC